MADGNDATIMVKGQPVTPNVAELPSVALKLTTFGRMSCCCMSSNIFKALSHCKPPRASATKQIPSGLLAETQDSSDSSIADRETFAKSNDCSIADKGVQWNSLRLQLQQFPRYSLPNQDIVTSIKLSFGTLSACRFVEIEH
jgi:hypothetical protein